jgi:hypothetical protein
MGGECRRRELNPHEPKAHYALNVARLPVPPLRRGLYFIQLPLFVNRIALIGQSSVFYLYFR